MNCTLDLVVWFPDPSSGWERKGSGKLPAACMDPWLVTFQPSVLMRGKMPCRPTRLLISISTQNRKEIFCYNIIIL